MHTVLNPKLIMNRIPPVTKNLLLINILLFLGSSMVRKYGVEMNDILGLYYFKATNFKLFQLFTYMFMHSGFQHIFFNMFAVWMFGSVLERTWGSKRYLFFYIACGIGAGIVQELVQHIHFFVELSSYDMVNIGYKTIEIREYLNLIKTVGASGAVYGILLGYGITYPNQPLFIIPFPFPIKAKWLITGYVILELILGFSNRPGDNVAHFAHLGGMLFAFFIIFYWKNKNRNNDNYYRG